MSLYNLTDNVEESFDVKMGDVVYTGRYPLLGELEELQQIVDAQNEAETPAEKRKLGNKMEDFLYSFFTPKTEGAIPIKDELKKRNIKVMQNFTETMKKEFGLGQ